VCGRYSLAGSNPADLRGRFPLGESVEVRQRFNVAPTDEVLTVTLSREGEPRGDLLRWGLVPHWAKDPSVGPRMINARSETVGEKPAFRDARRCLVLADGFFEWEKLAGGVKQPHWVTRPDRAPYAFAGLWTSWRGPGAAERALRTCTILTAAASGPSARIHDRIPVILGGADDEERWLTGAPLPSPVDDLLLTPVGPAVNDARYDGPDCLQAAEPPATLF
jgi:putative SOS response-associated peptidase YedK